jgi:hypothetical protein
MLFASYNHEENFFYQESHYHPCSLTELAVALFRCVMLSTYSWLNTLFVELIKKHDILTCSFLISLNCLHTFESWKRELWILKPSIIAAIVRTRNARTGASSSAYPRIHPGSRWGWWVTWIQ